MKYQAVALGVCMIATMSGQKRMSWQNLCFNNPGAPVCQGNDYAVKPDKKAGRRAKQDSSTTAAGAAQSGGTESDVDWRFAHPGADALVGFHVSALRDSALARQLLLEIGSKQELKEADLQKVFQVLSGVDQIVVSVNNNRAVALLVGDVSEAMFPSPQPGMRAVQVSENALLFGQSGEVADARQRITTNIGLSEITAFGDDQYGESDFWAIASPSFGGPQAASASVRRLTLTVSLGDRIASDFGVHLFVAPTAEKLKSWQPILGETALDGASVHARRSIETEEARQKLADLLAGPVGASLARLVAAAHYLEPSSAPKQERPVIVGLD